MHRQARNSLELGLFHVKYSSNLLKCAQLFNQVFAPLWDLNNPAFIPLLLTTLFKLQRLSQLRSRSRFRNALKL